MLRSKISSRIRVAWSSCSRERPFRSLEKGNQQGIFALSQGDGSSIRRQQAAALTLEAPTTESVAASLRHPRSRDPPQLVSTQDSAYAREQSSISSRWSARLVPSRVDSDQCSQLRNSTQHFLLKPLLDSSLKVCGSHYVLNSATAYSCSGYANGRTCSNGARARRDALEYTLLEPVRAQLLTPARVERMAKEMQAYYVQSLKAMQARALEAPRELHELTARIERLRERLKHGDPDMTPADIQAAIDRAETQRRELQAGRTVNGGAKSSASVLTILPRAAAMFRKQIVQGLDGDPAPALKARGTLRELFCGQIDLSPGLDPAMLTSA
jgi:hypothetical protein